MEIGHLIAHTQPQSVVETGTLSQADVVRNIAFARIAEVAAMESMNAARGRRLYRVRSVTNASDDVVVLPRTSINRDLFWSNLEERSIEQCCQVAAAHSLPAVLLAIVLPRSLDRLWIWQVSLSQLLEARRRAGVPADAASFVIERSAAGGPSRLTYEGTIRLDVQPSFKEVMLGTGPQSERAAVDAAIARQPRKLALRRGGDDGEDEDLTKGIDDGSIAPTPLPSIVDATRLKLPEGPAPYGLDDATRDVFATPEEIERWRRMLEVRKNVVLQGAPGVGKTYAAQRLAWLLLGVRDPSRVSVVQFHQSYAYEDFVQGYRPGATGFSRVDGHFLHACEQARDRPFVLIIDEINRGNLSRIFGELLMLLEADKRGPDWQTRLAYHRADDVPFSVPANLHIIGTMNTADRSLALVDYALRRRFAFMDVRPGIDRPGFRDHLKGRGLDDDDAIRLIERIMQLNDAIESDPRLGAGFLIGHSYFCGAEPIADLRTWLRDIVDCQIAPVLKEYWFDEQDRANEQIGKLRAP